MVKVNILITGIFKWLAKSHCQARCTTTLIRANGLNIVVDPGNVSEASQVKKALKKYSLFPRDIHLVINSHNHSDHAGANFLFPRAVVIDGESLNQGDEFVFYNNKIPLILAPEISLIATPGHTATDCSVLIKTKKGMIAVVGDLFWQGQQDKLIWMEYPLKLKASQAKILKSADHIIPGHGKMFKVKK
jgi:glyoxylase-like metal-dependent hydrolase (beta-lactamase superfamily II)